MPFVEIVPQKVENGEDIGKIVFSLKRLCSKDTIETFTTKEDAELFAKENQLEIADLIV